MKLENWQLLLISFTFLIGFSVTAFEMKVVEFDGRNWDNIQAIDLSVKGYERDLKIQVAKSEQKVFFRVRIPQKEPSLKHRPWVLKNEKFVVGKQHEDSLVLRFSQSDKSIEDLWFWGANRTQ